MGSPEARMHGGQACGEVAALGQRKHATRRGEQVGADIAVDRHQCADGDEAGAKIPHEDTGGIRQRSGAVRRVGQHAHDDVLQQRYRAPSGSRGPRTVRRPRHGAGSSPPPSDSARPHSRRTQTAAAAWHQATGRRGQRPVTARRAHGAPGRTRPPRTRSSAPPASRPPRHCLPAYRRPPRARLLPRAFR